MGGRFFDLLMYTVLAAIILGVVTHGSQAAQLVTSGAKFWVDESSVLSGNKAPFSY